MNFPAALKYTKDHEWILFDGNRARIGITEFAQRELGDIVYVEVKEPGTQLAYEHIFGTIEASCEVFSFHQQVGSYAGEKKIRGFVAGIFFCNNPATEHLKYRMPKSIKFPPSPVP